MKTFHNNNYYNKNYCYFFVSFKFTLKAGEALEEIEDENKSILWALLKQVSEFFSKQTSTCKSVS